MSDQPETNPAEEPAPGSSAGRPSSGFSRRRVLAGAGAGAAIGLVAGAGTARALDREPAPAASDAVDLSRSYPFYTGTHQPGIETPPQRHTVFMTFDVVPSATTRDLQVLLARWSASSAQLMKGAAIGLVQPPRDLGVPTDTGEAADLGPASLTVTLGLGPGIFTRRFGLQGKRPKLLADLPSLPSDQLQPAFTGGDLSLQACADDPQVAYHAIRDLARIGRGVVETRWVTLGFGRASVGAGQSTPRNLMGFKDGTRNITTPEDFDEFVWVGDDDVDWMSGGSYLVVRKIRMTIEVWDALDIGTQQQTFGRSKLLGAPLTGSIEHDLPDFAAQSDGKPVIDPTSHVALAASENNEGVKILRRGYNFTDGIGPLGTLDAGLLFVSYQNDPAHFIRLQERLGSSDLLNEYIAHVGSGIFAVPPGVESGHYLGEDLFA